MHDAAFEIRLASALRRYGAMAPDLRTADLVDGAVSTRRPRAWFWTRPTMRHAYMVLLLALLLVALVVTFLIGANRPNLIIPLGRNGAIAFYVQGNDRSGNRSYTLNGADGTLVESLGLCPIFSADGTRVAYRTGDRPNLIVAYADGSSPQVIPGVVEIGLSAPVTFALSPDGRHVAWFHDDELTILPADGGAARLLLAPSGRPNEQRYFPAWSPDGRRIAYVAVVSDGVSSYRSGVYVVDVDDAEVHAISNRPARFGEDAVVWSPDGHYLAYAGAADGAGPESSLDVFVALADGSAEHNITDSPSHESQPEWSPDGQELAYLTAIVEEMPRVATQPITDGVSAGQSVQGPETPWFVWAPDSTAMLWLHATRNSDGGRTSSFMVVDRGFKDAPVTLQSLEASVLCKPSWQRLAP